MLNHQNVLFYVVRFLYGFWDYRIVILSVLMQQKIPESLEFFQLNSELSLRKKNILLPLQQDTTYILIRLTL